MKVLLVFAASGEGDGWTIFDLAVVATSVEVAKGWVAAQAQSTKHDLVHPSMTVENNWAFVGKRDDCKSDCTYGRWGGYVIEEAEVIE
jgi:hypothetical protein